MVRYRDIPVAPKTHLRFRQFQRLIALRDASDTNSTVAIQELLDTWEDVHGPIPMPEEFEHDEPDQTMLLDLSEWR